MADTANKLTIFMYPWFAMGHITPYLLTANKLAERGHKITLVIPPKAQSKLGQLNLHPDLVHLRPISIPKVEGLPAHIETSNDATVLEQQLLRHALDLTAPTVKSLLCDVKPDLVISDFAYWLPGLARRMQIKSVHFSAVSPAAMGFMFTGGTSPTEDDLHFPLSIKLYKHTARDLEWFKTAKEMGSGITMEQRLTTAISESDAVCFKTCSEIEGAYVRFLENKLKKPILLTGPLLPNPQSSSTDLDEKWANWLNKFTPKTVIFCAFGSEAVLSKEQFQELMLGLELTGFPFLIALRPPVGFDTIEEALPNGFTERVRERGFVHGGWVPQQLILKHTAVGCFVTHCGYGSMWEGLMSECRLVALPHVADQYVQARLLSGVLKVAVEVEKGDEDGLFTKEGVCGAVMAAMAEESGVGEEVVVNHEKWRGILGSEGFQDSYFDAFVENLRKLLD
ncbi:hypothetical protein ABFS82_13G101700 [Erythranthe guttata]|uniref:anthocyanidin 3-O-glucoside 2''-O-glucosyltransferase-like n=1 Tax=Erythranthe guttata TaxID=4155 RepID=UPI00064DF58C|nr:PREDICTED: anthocyanidin 3-O-glucoside 2''-O-glucosyltransferase-like [Erythranthe guttata]|eukprot:XP_012848943.1 PREDICTED: anthocyanidin 3-O-glucoside 2''-O-glucosyltransferase-like [Erythranthe guttata]